MNKQQILDFNAKNIVEFRSTGGTLSSFGDAPVLLLTTTGARSGLERVNPMMYLADEDDPNRVYVFASAAGADRNPAWFWNLVAHPDSITVEIGSERLHAEAEVVSDPGRARIYDIQAKRYRGFAAYQAKTARPIPVVALTLDRASATNPTHIEGGPLMKTVRYHEYGDSHVLRYEDADTPHPSSGQVLVQVAATSFNPLDVGIRFGALQQVFPIQFPHTPGIDVAGTVAELGDGVEDMTVGDRIVGFLPLNENGAAAEFVLAPAEVLTAAPTSVSLTDAAALPSAGLSAWQSLFELAGLQAGQRIFINGAGGGVGGFAVQLAKQAGAHVVATASARSAEAVRAAGADEILDYTEVAIADAISEPLDAVLSLVRASEQEMASLVELIRPGGVIVTTATGSDGDPERDVEAHNLFVRSDAAQLAELVRRVDAGELRVDVSATYRLSQLAEVQDRGAAGAFRGKVIITAGETV